MSGCTNQNAPPVSRWRRALSFAFPYRRAVFGIVAITLVLAGVNAIEPLVLKHLFDHLLAANPARPVAFSLAALLVLGLFRETATFFSHRLTWHTRLGLHYQLLEATVERLHRLPLSWQRKEGVGAILTKLDWSIHGFIEAVCQILFSVFPSLVYIVLSVSVMVRLNGWLTLLVLCFAPLPALIATRAAPEQIRRERSLLNHWSRIYSRFNEVLSGIVIVRSFSMEDAEKRRFLDHVNEANGLVLRGVKTDTGFESAANLVTVIARIATLALGSVLAIQGHITVGTFVAFLGYIGGLFGPVQGLSGVYQFLRRASVSLDEIFSILDTQDKLGDRPGARELNHVRGDVEFEGIWFHYESRPQPLLRNIQLHVRPGETLAIVGPSGSGKTTLMALLMRFYDPQVGCVRIDGHDLRDLKQRSLRSQIGAVLQDPLLFNDTVSNNIAYGRPGASLAEVEQAARAAHAHEFIGHLPEGYETMVGERGSQLSVGERQRITIARALLKNPRIIILDEATSALDAESEMLVQDALDVLTHDRTTFVIAHRISTVVKADRIVVLKDGRILETGRHTDLVQRGGYYASLVRRQTRGLIDLPDESLAI